jgi:hypothetical protein
MKSRSGPDVRCLGPSGIAGLLQALAISMADIIYAIISGGNSGGCPRADSTSGEHLREVLPLQACNAM